MAEPNQAEATIFAAETRVEGYLAVFRKICLVTIVTGLHPGSRLTKFKNRPAWYDYLRPTIDTKIVPLST